MFAPPIGQRERSDSDLERGQFALDRQVLQAYVIGQAVLERRDIFTLDQRRQILAASLGDVEAVFGDEVAGHKLLDVGHFAKRRFDDVPAVGGSFQAADRRHDGVLAFQGNVYRGLAQGVGLLHVDLGGDVAGGALQVVSHGPVVLVAKLVTHEVGDGRRYAAQLGVAEGVGQAGFGQEFAVLVLDALGYPDNAVAVGLHALVNAGEEGRFIELDFGKQQDVRRFAFGFTGQAAGGGDPAGVATHDFQDEHLGRGSGHGGHIVAGFTNGRGDILGHRAKAGAAVGDRQVVVDRLRHVDGLDRIAHGFGQLGDLQTGVSGVTTAVIEEVTDVVGLEHLDQPLVFGAVGFQALELVAAGTEGTGRGVAQGGDVLCGFEAGIDQILGERANNAVAARVDFADPVRMLACRFNHAGGRSVDNCGNAA